MRYEKRQLDASVGDNDGAWGVFAIDEEVGQEDQIALLATATLADRLIHDLQRLGDDPTTQVVVLRNGHRLVVSERPDHVALGMCEAGEVQDPWWLCKLTTSGILVYGNYELACLQAIVTDPIP